VKEFQTQNQTKTRKTQMENETISLTKNVYKQPKKNIPFNMKFLRKVDVCEIFNISKTTLYRYEKYLGLPKHKLPNSRKILYRYDELMDWFGYIEEDVKVSIT
jgi:hypothetical protein